MKTKPRNSVKARLQKLLMSLLLFFNDIRLELTGIMLAGGTSVGITAHAGGAASSGSADPTSIVVSILDTIVGAFPAIGIVLALVGAFKLFMAFRNDQPDAYSGAAKDIVIGVILVVFKAFVWDGIKTALIG